MVVSLTTCALWLTFSATPADAPAAARQELKAAASLPDEAQALAAVEVIVRRYPTWELPRLEAAQLLLRRGDALDLCQWYLEAARAYAPENPRAQYLWALLMEERGKKDEAEAALKTALLFRSDYDEARQELGALELSLGRYPEAVDAYRAVVAHQPDATAARLALATALEKAGQKGEAVKLLKGMLPGPARLVAARKLSDLYRQEGKVKEAEKVMQSVDPTSKRVLRPLKKSRR